VPGPGSCGLSVLAFSRPKALWMRFVSSLVDCFQTKKEGCHKKCHLSAKKHLRPPAPNRKYPLTGGAEAHNGTPDGRRSDAPEAARRKILEMRIGRRCQVRMALRLVFCLALFEIAGY